MERDVVKEVLGWYAKEVRGLITERAKDRLENLDLQISSITQALERRDRDLQIAIIGNSGVGKSTLLNALVADDKTIVPSGGIGPLTAQALRVSYGETPSFRVEYHSAKSVGNLKFALDAFLNRLASRDKKAAAALDSLVDSDTKTIVEEVSKPEPSEESRRRKEEYIRQAQLLVTGKQDAGRELAYLSDALAFALGQPGGDPTAMSPEDAKRVEEIASILKRQKSGPTFHERKATGGDDSGFRDDLRRHAAGFLSPLVRHLSVTWNSALLRQGLSLTDLPGVGVSGDVFAKVTQDHIRSAEAVILMIDHRLIREPEAELLRSTGFLNRLLYKTEDPAEQPLLLIVVSRIDDIAESMYLQRDREKDRRPKAAFFEEAARSATTGAITSLKEELQRSWVGDSTSRSSQQDVVEQVLKTTKAFPVSAIQFRKLLQNDPDDPAFLKTAEASGVKSLQLALNELAEGERRRRTDSATQRTRKFLEHLSAVLESLRERFRGKGLPAAEIKGLRERLEQALKDLRDEQNNRRGEFRGFINQTVPEKIGAVVEKSKSSAGEEIRAYLKRLRDAHWSTLRAAVRRGGTFAGARHIDLPRDFTLTFEEPVADGWSRDVLASIRRSSREYSKANREMLQEVRKRVTDGTKGVLKATSIASIIGELEAEADAMENLGKDAAREMKDKVKDTLLGAIEEPIRRKCESFVKKGEDIGPGVRARILELFENLGKEVGEAAGKPARKVMDDAFDAVKSDIRKAVRGDADFFEEINKEVEQAAQSSSSRSDPTGVALVEAVLKTNQQYRKAIET